MTGNEQLQRELAELGREEAVMTEGESRTLGALIDGALTADAIAKRIQMSSSQVREHLRELAAIGFVKGNHATPRVWGMTGLAAAWSRESVGRCALGIQA